LTPEQKERYRTTAPAKREISTDSEAVKELKKEVRDRNLSVANYFRNRLEERALLTRVQGFKEPDVKFVCIQLYSYQTEEWTTVDEKNYEIHEDIVEISEIYMDTLPDGYYELFFWFNDSGRSDGNRAGYSQIWYIAQSDVYQEPEIWLKSNEQAYKGNYESVNVTVCMDSTKKISGISWADGTRIEESLYELLYGGRAIRLLPELLSQCVLHEKSEFTVYSKDGASTYLKIWRE